MSSNYHKPKITAPPEIGQLVTSRWSSSGATWIVEGVNEQRIRLRDMEWRLALKSATSDRRSMRWSGDLVLSVGKDET